LSAPHPVVVLADEAHLRQALASWWGRRRSARPWARAGRRGARARLRPLLAEGPRTCRRRGWARARNRGCGSRGTQWLCDRRQRPWRGRGLHHPPPAGAKGPMRAPEAPGAHLA
jgi:hypothetical protein